MSRDFTPAESYAFWQQLQKQHGERTMLDSMESTTITYAGKTSPMYSEESMQNRRQYPLLGSLFSGKFDALYALLTKTENGVKLLRQIENELDTIIKTKSGNENSYVFKWFVGKLDPGFYYSQENDRLFFEAVKDELAFCPMIDPSKITDSARISVTWDSYGIAVDFNYSHDAYQGYGESVLCFAEPYDDGNPNEDIWDEAQRIGDFLKDKYSLPLDIRKDESFIKAHPTLADRIAGASDRRGQQSQRSAESMSRQPSFDDLKR